MDILLQLPPYAIINVTVGNDRCYYTGQTTVALARTMVATLCDQLKEDFGAEAEGLTLRDGECIVDLQGGTLTIEVMCIVGDFRTDPWVLRAVQVNRRREFWTNPIAAIVAPAIEDLSTVTDILRSLQAS